jgi:hypothetical protein
MNPELVLAVSALHVVNLLVILFFVNTEEDENVFCHLYLWSSAAYSYGQLILMLEILNIRRNNIEMGFPNPISPLLMAVGAIITHGSEECVNMHLEHYITYSWYIFVVFPICVTFFIILLTYVGVSVRV